MAYVTSQYSEFAAQVAADDTLRAKVWQMRVRKDATQKNCLREMIGGEGSNMPIIEVQDLKKAAGDIVYINTVAGVGGQGILGENQLTGSTHKVFPGTFPVQVDYLRNAVSWTDKFAKMTQAGRSIDDITGSIMADWLYRKEEDDLQWVLLRTARLTDTSLMGYVNGRAGLSTLQSSDTINTNEIENLKGGLSSQGAKEMAIDKDVTGAEIAKYTLFAPDSHLRSLRTSTAYQAALRDADNRGKDNRLFTGKYGMWDNMVVYPHVLKRDSTPGRQGSPLAPIAYLGVALADATPTEINGGGGSVSPDYALGDFFANFPGYLWKIVDGETPPADSGTHYAMIYNVTGADKDKYEIFSYTTGNNGQAITSVTRGTTSNFAGNATANAASRFSVAHPIGSLIFPCTVNGVPYGFALGLGAEALAHAKGMYDAEKIIDGEDFHLASNPTKFFLKSFGLMSIRGLSPFQDTANRYTNFRVLTAAVKIPGIKGPEAYEG